MPCAPATAECGLGGSRGDQVLRVEIRIANNPHWTLHIVNSFPGHLEQAGAEISRDTVIRNRPFQTLIKHRAVETIAAAGMAQDHSVLALLQSLRSAPLQRLKVPGRDHRFAGLEFNI